MNEKTLLAVVAHPDDETFGMGGTLAYYADKGVQVHLICATLGEAGEVDARFLKGYKSVGDLRENELFCAAEKLGIREIHFLNYRDSGMPGSPDNQNIKALVQAPIEKVAREIAGLIRKIQPQIILTFDPVGGYMHPDHIAVHQATVRAFDMAGDGKIKIGRLDPFQSKKLYFHIFPRGFLRWVVKIMPLFGMDPRRFGKNKDINLVAIMEKEFPVNAKINYQKVADKRRRASACHASQGGDRQSGYIVNWLIRIFSSHESFMRAYPPPENRKVEHDLFDGI